MGSLTYSIEVVNTPINEVFEWFRDLNTFRILHHILDVGRWQSRVKPRGEPLEGQLIWRVQLGNQFLTYHTADPTYDPYNMIKWASHDGNGGQLSFEEIDGGTIITVSLDYPGDEMVGPPRRPAPFPGKPGPVFTCLWYPPPPGPGH